jgi:hypothetical protein
MRRATLRQEIQSQHDALSEVAPDTDAYHGRVAKVLDATDALVDHDSAVRARLRARAQRASLGTMRRSGAGVAVVMALLLLACVSGWIGVWWALLVLPSTALATGMFVLGGRRPDVEPRRLYAGTAAAGMAALGVVALVLARHPGSSCPC